MYLRYFVLALLLSVPVWAQFTELAVTDDASQVYFTSPLTLGSDARTGLGSELRVYRWTSAGVELVAERGAFTPTGPTLSGGSSDGVSTPQVSGDGKAFGFTYHNICPTPATDGGACTTVDVEAALGGATAKMLGAGALQLSHNGRWALLTSPDSSGAASLVDLQAGQTWSVPVPAASTFAVASDGSVLASAGVWRGGSVTPFGISGTIRPLALSGDGAVLVYQQTPAGTTQSRLIARNLASGTEAVIFTPAAGGTQLSWLMSVSNDGRWVLYRVTGNTTNGDAFLADTQAGTSIPIPLADGELASDGALTGAGDIAVIATTFHRIVKAGFVNGAVSTSQVIVPSTPYIPLPPGGLARGSRTELSTPMPDGTAGRILLAGVVLPFLGGAAAGQVAVQIPWEQNTGDALFQLDYPNQSPFSGTQRATVTPLSPAFELADAGTTPLFGIKFVKGDFSGLVISTPAPGDIIIAYMTGLGQVQGAVETGVPAPLDSLRPIVADLRCTFKPQTVQADTLFAGLAPGMIGLYQVSFRLASEPFTGRLTGLACGLYGPDGGASWIMETLTTTP